ncbi:MAG TPA: FGGY family carbohydrate kinase [Bacteroidales bacterium]|nr:FGGY family carbohydrate kinase [Bacteroidales bacterium]
MYILGFDAGSSSVKASVVDGGSGQLISSAYYPEKEMKIIALKPGWAEQDPDMWYQNLKQATRKCLASADIAADEIRAIGISYQMHGLVAVDRDLEPIRPSIIWCDSRAVDYGQRAFDELGAEYCFGNLLNSPANFTASKLAWIRENEPQNYEKIHKIMLPGDFIALKLTGEINTTITGLSEGIFWDFARNGISIDLLDYFGFDREIIPDLVQVFSQQGCLSEAAAYDLGLKPGVPVSYRSGDQPNNALSLKVLDPGEIAATAGTSGVIYGISDRDLFDRQSRVNIFAHVNHSAQQKRLGVLACINGAGILNSWMRQITGLRFGYNEMNGMAASVEPGSDGLLIFPFGNGAERLLLNRNTGAIFRNLNLNIHNEAHLFRAVQEGIAFSFRYGIDILKEMGIPVSKINAGNANMFLSPLFAQLIADLSGSTITILNTDGSIGAARGAGIGCGYYNSFDDAFGSVEVVKVVEPDEKSGVIYESIYEQWLTMLQNILE